jgi:hypothetical protein
MPQLLFVSASSGTGSEFGLGETIAADLLVYVPSASYGVQGVQLWGRLTGHSSSYVPLQATPLTSSVAQRALTAEGLYLYSNVGGTSVTARVEKSGSNEITIAANTILKR